MKSKFVFEIIHGVHASYLLFGSHLGASGRSPRPNGKKRADLGRSAHEAQ
jgi:hypothetical protein